MADLKPVGRFAPTPSGRMHLGNVFAALIAWLSVRSRDGEMVLRMEDLDTQRTSAEFAEILRDDLRWLGFTWDRETPAQSQRSAVYDKYFEILREKGLLYPCYCTRSQLHSVNAPHLSDGTYVYPGTCRNLTEGEQAAFRRPPWGKPNSSCKYICRGAELSKSMPRTTSVTPASPSSTVTASW